jgi:hypothetical protein
LGEARNDDVQVGFAARLKSRFRGVTATNDARLLAQWKRDESLGFISGSRSKN